MMYNILYDNRIIYTNITEDEEVKRIILELAEKAADGVIDTEKIDVEEI